MPLTNLGKKIKRSMEKSYGKKKGKQVFYAWENKNKGMTEKGKREIIKKTNPKGKPIPMAYIPQGASADSPRLRRNRRVAPSKKRQAEALLMT